MCEWRTIARSPTGPGWTGSRRSGTADREEVEGPPEIGSIRALEREVGRGDRGDEAIVEALGETERGVDAVPARADRELVDAELSGVEDAEELDALEMGLEQVAVLAGVVLAQVPGIAGALGVGRRQGQPVRGRDVGERSRGGEALAELPGVADVLDRLQEDDRVARPVEALDEPAVEADVGTPVARPGVLVGLRVGVDPDDLGRRPGEDVRSVALPA